MLLRFLLPLLALSLGLQAQERGKDVAVLEKLLKESEDTERPKEESEEAERPPGHPPGLDHLTPVEKETPDYRVKYNARLKGELKLDDFAFVRMVYSPSFEGESVVSLHGGKEDRDPEKTEKFFLTCRVAETNIWYSLPENSDSGLPAEVRVSVTTVPIDRAVALRVIRLWERMLERTREPDPGHRQTINDGASYDFSMPGKAAVHQWTPFNRLGTGIFCKLGHGLEAYCEGAWIERRMTAMQEIEAQAAKLERYLDEHPVK